jgi:hypothetical protein
VGSLEILLGLDQIPLPQDFGLADFRLGEAQGSA